MLHHTELSDFSEFLRECGKPDTLGSLSDKSSQREGNADFFGTETYAEADSLAVNGVPALETLIRNTAETFAVSCHTESHQRTVWDVAGDEPDVSRFLEGEPENMMSYINEERQGGKIVTLLVQGGATYNITTAQIQNRGAAILTLCDLLESAGYRLEIIYTSCSRVGDGDGNTLGYIALSFPLKRSQDVLDITRLTYALCHASMFRRHVWKWRETLDSALRVQLGMYSVSDCTVTDDLIADHIQHDIFMDRGYYEFTSEETSRLWLAETLEELGVEFRA